MLKESLAQETEESYTVVYHNQINWKEWFIKIFKAAIKNIQSYKNKVCRRNFIVSRASKNYRETPFIQYF